MQKHRPDDLDMTIEGEFVSRPKAPLSNRIMMWAIIVSVLASAFAIAALALWLAMIILPVAVAAGLVAYGLYRYRLWRLRQSFRGQGDLWRP